MPRSAPGPADDALGYRARPASTSGPAVLVLHSWWGMTRSFVEYADRVAAAGLVAGCVDLYGGAIAATAHEAKALRSAPRRESMSRNMIRACDALLADQGYSSRSVALVGFSMGGHWAVWLAQRPDVPVAGVVVHYATRAVTKSTGPRPVLAHFAEEDPFVTAGGRRTMERSFARYGWPYRGLDYPGTGHWFAESAEGAYDQGSADLAFGRSVEFLRELSWS